MVAYGQRTLDNNFRGLFLPTDGKAKQFSLGYEHNLSKRTSVYVAASNLKVNDSLHNNLGANAAVSAKSYAVGIKHNF
jgi:predicted porin